MYARVFVCDQEVITKCSTFVFKGVGGCGLGELVGLCVLLFLRGQVRDLRVQEFLSELLALMILRDRVIVKILHCGEGGNVEQVVRSSK